MSRGGASVATTSIWAVKNSLADVVNYAKQSRKKQAIRI